MVVGSPECAAKPLLRSDNPTKDHDETVRRELLELVLTRPSLPELFAGAIEFAEREMTGATCSILILDESGRCLRVGAAPRLPEVFSRAMNGLVIGPGVGSCGAAAYSGHRVIIPDLEVHSNSEAIRELARQAGLRSCWSEPIRSSDGAVIGTFSTYYDTPRVPSPDEIELLATAAPWVGLAIARARIEEKLRDSERRLVDAQRTAQVGSWEVDFTRNQALWSEEGYRLLGVEPGQPASQELFMERVHPEDRDAVRAGFQHAIASGTFVPCEFRVVLRDGQTRWLSSRATVTLAPDGAPLRFLGTSLDITDRKRVELALRQREREYATLLSNLSGMVYRCRNDARWTVTFASQGSLELTGYAPDELIGNSAVSLAELIHPDDASHVWEKRNASLANGNQCNLEYRIRTASGEEKWVWDQAQGIFEADQLVLVEGLLTDITPRRRAEEARAQLEVQLQRAQKLESLGVMAGGIAHDFNNLLMAVLGSIDLAINQLPSGSTARPLLDDAFQGARRAAELTQQMLAYSGKGPTVTELVNLSTLIEEMQRLLRLSISKKCVMRFMLMPGLPTVEGDPSQLRQVLMNLVINASEAIADRTGLITVRTGMIHCDRERLSRTYVDEQLPEGPYVQLEISDDGAGMSAETRARIFDPFFTTKFIGRGLGLSTVLGIVRGHRGAISCESAPGSGTTFSALFPVAQHKCAEPTKHVSGEAEQRTILVVDDEPLIRSVIVRMLGTMGCAVLIAADGREAVDIYRTEGKRIDLVLLDMTMPYLDGLDCLREMRRIHPEVRAVLMSGFSQEGVQDRLAEMGVAAFLKKPFDLRRLEAVVHEMLGISNAY